MYALFEILFQKPMAGRAVGGEGQCSRYALLSGCDPLSPALSSKMPRVVLGLSGAQHRDWLRPGASLFPLGTLDVPSSIVLTQKAFKDKMGPVACPCKAFQNQDGSRTLWTSIFLDILASLTPRTFPIGPSQSLMGKKRLESD